MLPQGLFYQVTPWMKIELQLEIRVYIFWAFAVLKSAHFPPTPPHSHGQYFYFQITKDEYEPFISSLGLLQSYANSGCSGSGLVFALPPK